MQAVANYLVKNKEAILEEWKEGVKGKPGSEGGNGQISELITVSREEFYDHIPSFLDLLIENIRNGETPKEKIGKRHGLQRWRQNADLSEIVHEWGTLHRILSRKINRSENFSLIDTGVLTHAQEILTESIHDEIYTVVDQYLALHQRQAKIRVDDLEEALRNQEDHSIRRGVHLHQATHDLKGSMFAIITGFRFLKEEESFNDDVARRIKQMAEAAESINELLNELLDLSRLEAGQEELELNRFDAAKVLPRVSSTLEPVAEDRGLELRSRGEDSLPVQGDRLKVKRIAQNLLLNALENTSSGYVEISWEAEPPDQWQLCVRDTGSGLAAPDEPVDMEAEEGSNSEETQIKHEGIGLLIVHQLCKLLDAMIEVETEAETGTLFRVTLPADYS